MSKETYGIRVEDTERDKLRSIDTKVIRSVLHMLCDIYEDGMSDTDLIVFDIQKKYIEGEIDLHRRAIEELQSRLIEVEENIEEQKQVHVKTAKALEDAWELLYVAHFKQERIRSPYNLRDELELIEARVSVPQEDIIRYCVNKLNKMLTSLYPVTVKGGEIDPHDAKVNHECEWLKLRLIDIDNGVYSD